MENSMDEKQPQLVIARYKFEGRNNDELSFAKNDVISLTQQLDGSLDGRVGWFPADFVGIVKANGEGRGADSENSRAIDASKLEANRIAFRAQLVQDFMAKERDHLATIDQTLEALQAIRPEFPREQLFISASTNLADFANFKRTFFMRLGEQIRQPVQSQQIGKFFLERAPEMRCHLLRCCENHSQLVELLNGKSDQVQKRLAQTKMDLRTLVLGLSLFFRHAQKYAGTLHEIERHTSETHFDRGNLQRAAQVYLDFHEECEFKRRQREAQLDFARAGILQQSFGTDFETKLGALLYTGKVGLSEGGIGKDEEDFVPELDRCIAVFSSSILLLEMQTANGTYSLKNQFGTGELIVRQMESGNIVQLIKGKDVLSLRSAGKSDFGQLLEALRTSVGQIEVGHRDREDSPMKRRHRAEMPVWPTNNAQSAVQLPPSSVGQIRLDHQLEMPRTSSADISNEIFSNGLAASCSSPGANRESGHYSGWALRPIAPRRADWLPSAEEIGVEPIKLRKGLSAEEQEDALLLKVVEGYCLGGPGGTSSAHRHHQRNSAGSCGSPCGPGGPVRRAASYPEQHHEMARPQLIVVEDEKLFVEEMEGDQVVVKERSLVDTVYALKDQLTSLTQEVASISKSLEQEQRARRRLEETIRQTNLTSDTMNQPSDLPSIALKSLNGNA